MMMRGWVGGQTPYYFTTSRGRNPPSAALHLAGRTVPLQPMVACIARFSPHDCGM